MHRSFLVSTAVILLLGGELRADTLSDVRAALIRLSGGQPVRASLQLFVRNQNGETGVEEGRTFVRLSDSSDGLVITYPATEISKASAEQKAEKKNPETKTPTRQALHAVDAVEASEMLDYSTTLLTRLEGSQVIQDKLQAYGGRPARLLVVKLQPALSKTEKKRVKEMTYEMSLWVGNEGLPLAAETSLKVVAKFMLLTFRHNEKESWSYARVGDRLAVTKYQQESSGSGMGQEFQRRKTAVLTFN